MNNFNHTQDGFVKPVMEKPEKNLHLYPYDSFRPGNLFDSHKEINASAKYNFFTHTNFFENIKKRNNSYNNNNSEKTNNLLSSNNFKTTVKMQEIVNFFYYNNNNYIYLGLIITINLFRKGKTMK